MKACLLTSVVLLLAGLTAFAEEPCSTTNLDAWINCRMERIAAARINQRDGSKQAEAPAATSGSTTLVDSPAAPDLGGLFTNLASLSGISSSTANTTPFTFSTSGYALISAVNGKALDPHFYNANRDWRRFSFTIGHEDNDDSGDGPANIFGGKFLLYDGRDATNPRNQHSIATVREALKTAAVNFAQVSGDIVDYLFKTLGPAFNLDVTSAQDKVKFLNNQLSSASLANTVGMLKDDQIAHIDNEIIANRVDPEVQFSDAAVKAIEDIRRAPQLGLNFTSKIRPHLPVDDYRLELTWAYGIYRRLDWTANLSYDYRNFTDVGADTRGGRFANQFEYQITSEKNLKREPVKIALSGEGDWKTSVSSTYQVSGKLTLPILQGIALPISVSWANRTDLISQSFIRGNFGLTVDVSKLVAAFQGKHAGDGSQ